MKNVMIPEELFGKIIKYHLLDQEQEADDIRKGLEKKLDAMPVYERQEITDDLHETCGFRTDYQFITKRKMKGIQKKSKRR